MSVWALGLNHTTAPLDLRGRFAYALDQIEPTLRGLRESALKKVFSGLSTLHEINRVTFVEELALNK